MYWLCPCTQGCQACRCFSSIQAIKSFSEALREQDLRLKEIKTQSEGTRRSIISCQEKHDYLTSVEQRMDKLCGSRKSQVRHELFLEYVTKRMGALSKSFCLNLHHNLMYAARAKHNCLFEHVQSIMSETKNFNSSIFHT